MAKGLNALHWRLSANRVWSHSAGCWPNAALISSKQGQALPDSGSTGSTPSRACQFQAKFGGSRATKSARLRLKPCNHSKPMLAECKSRRGRYDPRAPPSPAAGVGVQTCRTCSAVPRTAEGRLRERGVEPPPPAHVPRGGPHLPKRPDRANFGQSCSDWGRVRTKSWAMSTSSGPAWGGGGAKSALDQI